MNFPGYYQVFDNSHISYVESHVFVDANQSNGYKWYQSCPSSDGMATSPLHYSVKYRPPEPPPLSSHGNSPDLSFNPYYPSSHMIHYVEPPPLPTLHTNCAPYLYTPPFTFNCHTTPSSRQPFLDLANPFTTPCSTITSLSSVMPAYNEKLQISGVDVVIGGGNGLAETVVGDEDNLQLAVLKSTRAVVGTVNGNGQIDDRKLVKKAVEVQGELMVDAVEIAPQMFDEIPIRNSTSLEEKVSGDARDITTQGTDKIIQTTDRILLQMEEIKHLLLAMYPPSKRGEVNTTHKADPTPIDEDPLVIQATEVEVATLGENFEFRTTNPEESLLKEEVKASNLKGAFNGIAGILKDVFETGSSLKELAEIGNTKIIENFVMKTDERLGADRLFIANYRVEIVSDMLAIDSVGNKESRDESGKEGGVANEEGVLVPVNSSEQSFTAHTIANGLDKWYASTGKKNMLSFDPGGATINEFLSTTQKGILELLSKIYIMSIIHADEMLKRDVTIRNLMSYGFCKSGDIQLGLQHFREMPEWPVFPVNSMPSGLAKCGRDSEAMKLFQEMRNAGIVCLGSLIYVVEGKPIANDWDEWYVTAGKKKLRNMHFRRSKLVDTSVFSGFVDEALSVLNEFKRQGMELHVVPCTSMIASCSQLCNDTEASGLFRVLQIIGVKPKAVTTHYLLLACGNIAWKGFLVLNSIWTATRAICDDQNFEDLYQLTPLEICLVDDTGPVPIQDLVLSCNKLETRVVFLVPEMCHSSEIMGVGFMFMIAFANTHLHDGEMLVARHIQLMLLTNIGDKFEHINVLQRRKLVIEKLIKLHHDPNKTAWYWSVTTLVYDPKKSFSCGADLKALCTEAVIRAFREKYPQVDTSDDKYVIDIDSVAVKNFHFIKTMLTIALVHATQVLKEIRTTNRSQKRSIQIIENALKTTFTIVSKAGGDGALVLGKLLAQDDLNISYAIRNHNLEPPPTSVVILWTSYSLPICLNSGCRVSPMAGQDFLRFSYYWYYTHDYLRMARVWYWSVIRWIFDPGDSNCYYDVLQSSTILEDKNFFKGNGL